MGDCLSRLICWRWLKVNSKHVQFVSGVKFRCLSWQVKQNYKVNTADPMLRSEGMPAHVRDERRELYHGVARGNDFDSATIRLSQDGSASDLSKNKFRGGSAAKFDADFAKLKFKTAQEAARAAAVAVAEAEAAAAAAERAAIEAEAAEAEAEAAELAVELATLAARNSKRGIL